MQAKIIYFTWLFGAIISLSTHTSQIDLSFNPQSEDVLVDCNHSFAIIATGENIETELYLTVSDSSKIALNVSNTTISVSNPVYVGFTAIYPGQVYVNATAIGAFESAFFHVNIQYSFEFNTVSVVLGWIYFVAWSVSFYPQIYDNWKRKSVVGLNMDFLALNLVGFFLYSLFNGFMMWEPLIRDQFHERFPTSNNPVQINDVVFSFHAFFAVVLTIAQCFIYERGDQRISLPAKGLLLIFGLFLAISAICAAADVQSWLDFLYQCSYVKLAITLIKYVPQAFMNFRRKSTVGWSVGNVFLDFTGGMLSMLQMIILAWNFEDWDSLFGDPTKFGLGLFSVVFDLFFLFQHYILYRHSYLDFPEPSGTISQAVLVS